MGSDEEEVHEHLVLDEGLCDRNRSEQLHVDLFGFPNLTGDGKTKLPSEAAQALRLSQLLFDRISNGGKVTRGELRRVLIDIDKVLNEYA